MPFHLSRGKAYQRLTTKTTVVEPKTLLAWPRLQNINLSLLWYSVLFPSKQGSSKNFTCTHMGTHMCTHVLLLPNDPTDDKENSEVNASAETEPTQTFRESLRASLTAPRVVLIQAHPGPKGKRTAELSTSRTPKASCMQQGLSPSQPPAKTPH